MPTSQIFLVIVSGLGVIHGLFLAMFLWSYTKGSKLSNRLLSSLLVVLSFRVGKSVFLEFAENLDVKFIFTGLGTLMAIGPLFYLYARSLCEKNFEWARNHLLHFIPSLTAIIFGIWIEDIHFETWSIFVFLFLFLSYYGHYIAYLLIANRFISKQRKEGLGDNTYHFLRLLFFGLLVIWIAYVLNLFDESVPYIVGPVLYSIVAYVISFRVIQKGYIQNLDRDKYKTTPISEEQMDQVFSKARGMIVDNKKFRDPDLTLKSLSATLHVSPQILSMVINQRGKKNFNNFINQHRVEEAIHLFKDGKHENLNISAIAFDVGFNSISSFNSAFKKETGKTPKAYRQLLPE
ncbi:MAG: AraC family transcriptional regulator [Cyclobacteriaceae bacterium]